MKLFQKSTFALAAFSLAQGAWAQSVLVEIGVQRVFIPSTGFDDNDTVEMVIDGELPNSCYSLEKNQIQYSAENKSYTVKQFAVKQTDGLCASTSTDDPRLTTPVPFTDALTIGKVSEGSYSVRFSSDGVNLQSRPFDVALAPVMTIDTLPYAMVTNVAVSDIVHVGNRVYAEVSGILNNSCYELNENVQVQKIGDVVLVLPTISVNRERSCLMYVRPFSKTVDLGILASDRYLVHVRSMNGKSRNRVFSVTDAK